jgi:chromosome segregation and condensation protein ScpB
MIQAADTVDGDLAGTTTGLVDDPLVKVLVSLVQSLTRVTEQLTEAAADMVAGTVDRKAGSAVMGSLVAGLVQPSMGDIAETFSGRKKAQKVGRKLNGERRILIAVAQLPDGATRQQLTVITGYKASTRNAYIQRLRARGVVEDTDRVRVTDTGRKELGSDFEPLPTGSALVERLRTELPDGEWLVLEALLARSPLTRDEIGERTGYKPSTRNAYIQRLRARELIYVEGDLLYPDGQLIGE